VDAYIKRPYAAQQGNLNGVPFVHLSVNIVPHYFLQAQTDVFIEEYGLQIVADDYNSNPSAGPLHTNAVHDSFQQPFLKPVILVINCVSNSTSHLQWTLLLNHGGGSANWTADMGQWRQAIDSVQAQPPLLTDPGGEDGFFQFVFPGQRGRTNRIECTTDFVNWSVVTNVFGTNAPITFRDANGFPESQRFYRVRRL
jgi:hypothetical protein